MRAILRTNIQPGIGTFTNVYLPKDGDTTKAMRTLWEEDYNLLADDVIEGEQSTYFGDDDARIDTKESTILFEVVDIQEI